MSKDIRSDFDYDSHAELFSLGNAPARTRRFSYMRFDRAADAIRFAMEKLPASGLLSACLEVEERRYDCSGIRRLYEGTEYPFPRRTKAG